MRKWWIVAGLILLLLGSAACSQQSEPTATPALDPTATSDQASSEEPVSPEEPPAGYPSAEESYPAPEAEAEPGYPAPEVTRASAVMEEVPAPSSSETATVTGVLLVESEEDALPVPEVILYLGKTITLSDGRPGMSSLNKSTAPSTQTNLVGQFIFEDVAPGQYTLVLDQITSTFLLGSPDGGDLLIEVNGGEVVDLGELQYNSLPIDVGQ